MTKNDSSADVPAPAVGRAGIHLAVLQLAFTLGWTTYAIYLPRLAADVGIAPSAVILLLMLDQAIFTVTDTAMGIAADRVSPVVGRLGRFVGLLAAISCAAFVALPFVAAAGPGAQAGFLVLTVIWVITSSALRAPPLTLLGKYGARPALPLLSALAMLGYGLAGAVSPYLGIGLRDQDPRLPFVISSVVLLLVALALSRVERGLADRAAAVAHPAAAPKPPEAVPVAFIAATVVLALGFQLHLSINSPTMLMRFAAETDLQWLLPIFWIGFNIAMFPATLVVKRRGGLVVMGAAAVVGAMAVLAAETATSLEVLIAAQFMAGAAWGCMLMSAVAAALAIGATGAEGKVVGLVFSALALATFARMAAVAGGLPKQPDYAWLLHWAPAACWAIAGAGLLWLATARLRRR
uniref:Major facilitator superfamily (MFS) profile domain-containing protein n=1 Tax=Rhodopseudomonas palustris (strain BisA53) TaxID=316055 RepID=Q07QN8_RHOP5